MAGNFWSVRDSRYLLKDRWLRLRADDCSTPSGVEVSPYYVLEFPDFVHVLAINNDDKIVLVRQYRHGYGDLILELPGGVQDARDHDVLVTAKRELQEETGYVCENYVHIMTLSSDPARYANRLHLVCATGVALGVADPEPSENIEVILFTKPEVIRLALSGGIINAQHVGLLMIGLSALEGI